MHYFHAFSSGSTRQPKESVQFVYNEPEVFTEGPDLQTGEAEMALYRSHVRHAAGPERAAGYHEVLCTIRSWLLIHFGNRRSKSCIILGHRLSSSSARGSLRLIFHAMRGLYNLCNCDLGRRIAAFEENIHTEFISLLY